MIGLGNDWRGSRFDVAIHQSGREVILEFEPSGGEPAAPLAILRTMALRVERQATLAAVYREVSRQVRGLTGFDRVMMPIVRTIRPPSAVC